MQFRISHILALTTYAAISFAAYFSLPQLIGAAGVFGKLGVGFISLGFFICLFVTFMLRMPADQRSLVQDAGTNDVLYDGQHWLDFLFPWITGALFVFFGTYSILYDFNDEPIPSNWWISVVPAALVLVGYVPVWRFLRTI